MSGRMGRWVAVWLAGGEGRGSREGREGRESREGEGRADWVIE